MLTYIYKHIFTLLFILLSATGFASSIKHVTASTFENDKLSPAKICDGNYSTRWSSHFKDNQQLTIELQKSLTLDGLILFWETAFAKKFEVLTSLDGKAWDKAFETNSSRGGVENINFTPRLTRYIRLSLFERGTKYGFSIYEITLKGPELPKLQPPKRFLPAFWNDYFQILASESPKGFYPKYFLNRASYWVVTGTVKDLKECLVNEEGAFEIEREGFSIEPFLYINNKLITWADVTCRQTLLDGYLPIPQITWVHPTFEMSIQVFCSGKMGDSTANASYTIKNLTNKKLSGKLFLAIRPFQVNPPWQKLNMHGGVAKVNTITYTSIKQSQKATTGKPLDHCKIDKKHSVLPQCSFDGFGACQFEDGDIIRFLKNGKLPKAKNVTDTSGFASAAFCFNYDLEPGKAKMIYIRKPLHKPQYTVRKSDYKDILGTTVHGWKNALNKVQFNVPKVGDKYINTLKSNLAYILINQDGYRIQPGSRSYLRSWIRDGAMTSSALLRMGNFKDVKEYLNMYSANILPDGRIPCAVDDRGAEGCPENDSNGEYIFGMLQYYHFTKDKAFIEKHFNTIKKAADFIIKMINERKTDRYKNTEFYGLVPESISHEGYSDKPMHSYWDDFFSLRGLKDAATITTILGKNGLTEKYRHAAIDFRKNLYQSIKTVMAEKRIPYIPGCAEKGDFDATSTAIALFPCGEYNHIPKDALNRTFDYYYQNFLKRLNPTSVWHDMTPYEIRNCQTFIIMDKRDRAHKLFDFFFTLQRPSNWNHWGEIVYNDADTGRWIGDMPHTWIGSSYINAVRSMFVYEDEDKEALVLGAGIPESWFTSGTKIGITNAPTYYGNISYTVWKDGPLYNIEASGTAKPPGKFILKLPGRSKFTFNSLPISTDLGKVVSIKRKEMP